MYEKNDVIGMDKINVRAYEALYPTPVVLVSSKEKDIENIITLAWVGTVCSAPPMVSISIRPSRFSHGIITRTKEFVVNVPSKSLLKEVDYCGVASGKTEDKWSHCKFTKVASKHVNVPYIHECPVTFECKVKEIVKCGSHDVFIAEILLVHQDKNIEHLDPIVYVQGEYWSLGEKIGSYGAV